MWPRLALMKLARQTFDATEGSYEERQAAAVRAVMQAAPGMTASKALFLVRRAAAES